MLCSYTFKIDSIELLVDLKVLYVRIVKQFTCINRFLLPMSERIVT